MPLRLVLFDLNGTLLDPSVMAGPLGGGEEERALVFRSEDGDHRCVCSSQAVGSAGSRPRSR